MTLTPARFAHPPLAPRRRPRAFTLVELLVVIAIIGLLSSLVAVGVMQRVGEAQLGAVRADMQRLSTACRLFRLHYHRDPETLDELLRPPPGRGGLRAAPFLEDPPVDPWGGPYRLVHAAGEGLDFESLGSDGQPGGENEAADLRWSELRATARMR